MGVWLYLKQNSKKNIRILFSLLLLFYNLGWKPDEYIKQTLRLDSFFSTFFLRRRTDRLVNDETYTYLSKLWKRKK